MSSLNLLGIEAIFAYIDEKVKWSGVARRVYVCLADTRPGGRKSSSLRIVTSFTPQTFLLISFYSRSSCQALFLVVFL
jgi:hypothetical protein